MNILCKNCGLRFDPLATDGVCPHCGRPTEAPAGGWQEPEAPPPAAPAGYAPAARRAGRGGRLGLVLTLVFAGAFLVEMIVFPLVTGAAKSAGAAAGYLPAAALSQAAQGETFALGPGEKQLMAGQAQRLPGLRGMPADGVMVRVWCEAGKTEGFYSGWGVDAFLQAGDSWYRPLSDYDLEKVYPELVAGAVDSYEFAASNMTEGWLYFAVPASAREFTLWFQSQTLDRDYDLTATAMTGVALTVEEGSVSEG